MSEEPAYYVTKNLLAGEPDRNRRFINRLSDYEIVATFAPDKAGWSDRNSRELLACLAALNAMSREARYE